MRMRTAAFYVSTVAQVITAATCIWALLTVRACNQEANKGMRELNAVMKAAPDPPRLPDLSPGPDHIGGPGHAYLNKPIVPSPPSVRPAVPKGHTEIIYSPVVPEAVPNADPRKLSSGVSRK